MRAPTLIALASAGVFFLACGSPSKPPVTVTPAPTAMPVSDADFKTAAQAAADGSVLTIADLPAGWTSEPDDSGPDTDAKTQIKPECRALFNEDDSPEVAKKSTDKFVKHSSAGIEVTSESSVYRTAEIALADEQHGIDAFRTCGDDLAALFKEGLTGGASSAEESVNAQTHFEPLSLPRAGEASNGFRVAFVFTTQGLIFSGQWDLVEVRVGRIIGSMSYMSLGRDVAQRDALLQVIANRIAAADAALPQ